MKWPFEREIVIFNCLKVKIKGMESNFALEISDNIHIWRLYMK